MHETHENIEKMSDTGIGKWLVMKDVLYIFVSIFPSDFESSRSFSNSCRGLYIVSSWTGHGSDKINSKTLFYGGKTNDIDVSNL